MEKIILATRNQGKIHEFKNLLRDFSVGIKSLLDYPDLPEIAETGTTFRENARIKAKTVFEITGMTTIADDSGLEVDALQGRPGIHSARYAGEGASDWDNNQKLLHVLADTPRKERKARFRSVICAVLVNGQEIYAEGICQGEISLMPIGDSGFGYDPFFLVEPDFQRTMAEISLAEKNAISHRARAFAHFRSLLETSLKEWRL